MQYMPRVALTDTHCHLNMQRFDADRESVIQRASSAGVNHILVPALDLDSARRILDLTEQYPCLYAAAGFHPTEIRGLTVSSMADLRRLVAEGAVTAIGEIGLDYYWVSDKPGRLEQQIGLRSQLDLAAEYALPVVLHMREQADADRGACADDMLIILEDWIHQLRASDSPIASRPGVLHSFAGTSEAAGAVIALGFCIGVTGPITYPSAEKRREVVRQLPLERLLIESDSPFLAPQQQRGRRNEPAFVAYIADRIAQVQSLTPGEVAIATSRNAARLFAWEKPD